MAHEGQYVKAQHMLEEALKLDPKLAVACANMAFLYFLKTKKQTQRSGRNRQWR